MIKKLVMSGAALIVIALLAITLQAKARFGSDAAQQALAAQLSHAFGQRVTVGSFSATALGRVTLTLNNIAAGSGAHIDRIQVQAPLTSLVTGRLDGAGLTFNGLHLTLPAAGLSLASTADAPLSLARVGRLTFNNLELTTRGRILRVNAELEPHGERALTVSRASIAGDDMHIDLSGEIADRATWKGELTATGDSLDGDVLLSLAWDLLEHPASSSQDSAAVNTSIAPPVVVNLEARRLTLGPLPVSDVKGRAAVGPGVAMFEPISFAVFDGRYKGQMMVRFEGGEPVVRWNGDVANINVAAVTAAADGSRAVSGMLTGDLDLSGSGIDFVGAMKSARGTAHITLANGMIGKLALTRAIMAANSTRPQETARDSREPADTAFSMLRSALTISGGSASLIDLSAEGPDFTIVGGGGLRLDGSAVTVFGDVQLTGTRSQDVATARGRQIAPGTRLVVPVTIRGNTSHYQIEVDVPGMHAAAAR
jgi:hypothetical protein